MVISGYLITIILIEDIENQRFSLVNFYESRAQRILPAPFCVMFVCIPFANEIKKGGLSTKRRVRTKKVRKEKNYEEVH